MSKTRCTSILGDVPAGQCLHTLIEGRQIRRFVVPGALPFRRRVLLILFAALSGWMAFAIFGAAAQGGALDAQVRSLAADNSRLHQQIDDRQRQIGEANRDDWLREQARRLGFVLPGESVFVITTPGAAVPPTGGLNAPLPTYAPATPTPSPSAAMGSSPSPAVGSSPSPTPVVISLPTPH